MIAISTTRAKNMEYAIGTKFKSRGKHSRDCVIVDVYKTFNSAGFLVRTSYVSTHEFCGQTLTNYDETQSAIARGLVK